ncbi:Antitoxin HigA1 [Micromonospora saelicesensis]|uniref:helix-turn-helix domain-containing protein n=1 Tax=Micromonospora saelicesensis TaxID=285676 RepID=UPI000DC55917|nr:helix-turn-helix transcriptional regulator [Micromonospora saelicesensis]RAO40504.1 Antitoxin HigA1 [Micromonospora saelicesensis]
MSGSKPVSPRRRREPEDLDRLIQEELSDPDARAVFEDAEARDQLIQYLSQMRKDRGWSQTQLAQRMKTTQSAVSDFEKSVVEPRLPTLQRWARAFGFRLEFALWEGPLLHYNSWAYRTLEYESVVEAVREDDEIARMWFAGAAKAKSRQEVAPSRVVVRTNDLEVDVHYRDPNEVEGDYWRELHSRLDALT